MQDLDEDFQTANSILREILGGLLIGLVGLVITAIIFIPILFLK